MIKWSKVRLPCIVFWFMVTDVKLIYKVGQSCVCKLQRGWSVGLSFECTSSDRSAEQSWQRNVTRWQIVRPRWCHRASYDSKRSANGDRGWPPRRLFPSRPRPRPPARHSGWAGVRIPLTFTGLREATHSAHRCRRTAPAKQHSSTRLAGRPAGEDPHR